MKSPLLIRLFLCISLFCTPLFLYLDRQNRVTELRINLPNIQAELQIIEEKNARYAYEIERFENPARLMELLRQPEFSHLRHPPLDEVLIVRKREAAQ